MKITKDVKFKWWQVSLFKISTIAFGIILGLYFRDLFLSILPIIWVLMAACGAYVGYVWYKQK